MEAFRQIFPNLDKNWEEFKDPKNGNYAPLDKPHVGIGGHWEHDPEKTKAHVRIPRKYTGMSYDMGLYRNKEGKWGTTIWDSDRYRFEKELQAADRIACAKEAAKTVTDNGGKIVSKTELSQAQVPSEIKMKSGEATVTKQVGQFTLEELRRRGANIEV